MTAKQTFPLLLILALPVSFLPPVQQTASHVRLAAQEVMEPLWGTVQYISQNLAGGTQRLGRFITLYRDYELLQGEVQSLRKEVGTLREIEKENARLSELLELRRKHPGRSLVGNIINRNISHWFRWVVIDQGRQDGVRERMALINDSGIIGRVIEAGRSVSQCILLTDPESRISGMIQSSRAVGVITGEGRHDRLRMSLIPAGSEVAVGDAVVTSGLGGIYPKGLLIGQVTTVGQESDGMHLFAYVSPAVNFNTLEEVLCIDSYPQD